MASLWLLVSLALGADGEVAEALAAWDRGCAAIRSYDVVLASEQKTLLKSDGSPFDPPSSESGAWRQVRQGGKRRFELLGEGSASQKIAVWDGAVLTLYDAPAKELTKDSWPSSMSPSGPAFCDYDTLYRYVSTCTYADVFRQRPHSKAEQQGRDVCVLYTPPLIGSYEYSPFGFRVSLDQTKNWMPVQVDYLLEVAGKEIVDHRIENTLDEVVPRVWAPVKTAFSSFQNGSPRKFSEGTVLVDRKQSSFNTEIADSDFRVEVPRGTNVTVVGDARAAKLFAGTDSLAEAIRQAVVDARLAESRVLLTLGVPDELHSQQLAALTDPADWSRTTPEARRALAVYRVLGLKADDSDVANVLEKVYGLKLTPGRHPQLIVIDGGGRVIAVSDLSPAHGSRIDKRRIEEFVIEHAPVQVDGKRLLNSALDRAKLENKRIYLQEGGLQCRPCVEMSRFLANHAEIIDQDFIVLKIDHGRHNNAAEVMKRIRKGKSRGIPWVAILDADGKVLTTSDDANGDNIGFPADPAGIDHFLKMLSSSARRMTQNQLKELRSALDVRANTAAKLRGPTTTEK
jgi:hypothetical protein